MSELDAPTRAVLADQGWRRLHRITPVLKAWKVLAVGLVLLAQQGLDDLLRARLPGWLLLVSVLGGLVLLALVGAGWSAVAWRRTRYRIDDEAVRLEQGVFWRQARSAQLDRLQAVDVVRPLLGRIFGLAELQLEVAGGTGSRMSLAYLTEAEAQRVRNALLAAAAGVRVEAGQEVPEAPQRAVAEVPPGRLVASTLASGWTLLALLVVAGAVVAVVWTRSLAPLTGIAAPAIGLVSVVWQRFSNGFGFSVAESPDGLRLRHGLLTQRAQTVPPGRVQALRISQPLLWRRAGWWTVSVNVAGYAGSGSSGEEGTRGTVLLPVGTTEDLGRVLAVVLPGIGLHEVVPESGAAVDASAPASGEQRRSADVLRAGLHGTGTDGGFTPAPRPARWLDPVAWRRHGFLVTDGALLARSGRLVRSLVVVPNERTQSLGLRQGPVQRRLGLASFLLHSTPGPVTPRVDHLDAQVAAALLEEQGRRSRAARAAAGPERWMRSPHRPSVAPAPPGDGAQRD
ncbi:PH domain-containing protein [Kineococcus gynurae]|uniref:PH domain-containing protein n=1 Tax=Kineococcus gynurae TaxID=452979 RepID=A0ABV5LTV8_9ACTN